MKSITSLTFAAILLFTGLVSGSMAGGGYHGYGMGMSDLSKMQNRNTAALIHWRIILTSWKTS